MRVSFHSTLFLLAAFILLATGCYSPTAARSAYATETQSANAPGLNVPTALVIVMEDESTEAEYRARRGEIVSYLIERGYIANENDLVNDPANADRIIRAIVSGGGFTLSVFNQNAATEPLPDLETTDILYPADPYFIFGFYYVNEIGPRRLPPRPPGYHPHPRQPREAPPPGRPAYDHDRHWSQPGQPDRNNGRHAPPPDRRHREVNPPRPDQTDHPPVPAPGKKPDDHTQPHPDTHAKSSPPTVPPKPRDQARPENDRHSPPTPTPPKSIDHPRPPDVDRRPNSNPPAAYRPPVPPQPAPAPEKSNDTERKNPPADDKDSRKSQN
jgi:hypothetical protein